MLRSLQVARRSALKARTQAANQLHALVVTAPDSLRTRLRQLSRPRLVETAAAFRPHLPLTTPTAAVQLALEAQLALLVAGQPPTWSRSKESAPISPPPCSSRQVTTPIVSDLTARQPTPNDNYWRNAATPGEVGLPPIV